MSESGVDISGGGAYGGIRYPLDPNADSGASEFSWGAGLTPKDLEDAPPSMGGRYRGTTPEETRPRVPVSHDPLI